MNLHNLQPAAGSTTRHGKKLGRGQGSGKGGTASKGHKGAKARTGYSKKIGFEGGQMPLQRRIPKFGFNNVNRKEYIGINLSELQRLVDKGVVKDVVDVELLSKHRIVKKTSLVKILGKGAITIPLKVKVHKFTESARKAIIQAGGEAIDS